MKNLLYCFNLLLIASFIFIGCNSDDDLVVKEGVVINGIRWATRNVDAPGTFAANPEDFGMTFQWNRRTGWRPLSVITGWDNSIPSGDEWERQNNPCPPGWRVPTTAEFFSLIGAASSIWTTENGVNGRFFGKAPNQIFLPAVGKLRTAYDDDGIVVVSDFWLWGNYWSKNRATDNNANALRFSGVTTTVAQLSRNMGLSVRCVAE